MQACTCIAILRAVRKCELHNGFWGWLVCNKGVLAFPVCTIFHFREFSALLKSVPPEGIGPLLNPWQAAINHSGIKRLRLCASQLAHRPPKR